MPAFEHDSVGTCGKKYKMITFSEILTHSIITSRLACERIQKDELTKCIKVAFQRKLIA